MFKIAKDSLDVSTVPYRMLNNGMRMPAIGIGTFGSDRVSAKDVACAVKGALSVGYRSIDCAAVYGNEKEIGDVLAEVSESGAIKREEIFITSKVWNDMHGEGDILISCANSLKKLRVEYLDLFLVHWPFPNYHAPKCDVDARNPDSRPFFIEEYMAVWRQMERLVDMGLVRAIGTSNMTIPKLEQLLQHARIMPAANELELHPHFQQRELVEYLFKKSILPIGYSPIGSPKRPDRDKTPEDTCDIEDPVICEIAQAHEIHPALVCIKWAVQNGYTPIPFSVNNYRKNLECILSDPLSKDEMSRIAEIDKNCRLIKGQVFLWEGASGWENLWDLDGVIDRTGWKN